MSKQYRIPLCRQCGEPRYDAHTKRGLCKECKKHRMTIWRQKKDGSAGVD